MNEALGDFHFISLERSTPIILSLMVGKCVLHLKSAACRKAVKKNSGGVFAGGEHLLFA